MSNVYDYDILDTEPEISFDQITRIAATLCGTPFALVSLLDSERQWFKSRYGLSVMETSRDVSFCAHAVLGNELFQVPDARKDPRFAENLFVTGTPNIRFYAGAPLRTPSGENIGTLCVIDTVPKELSDEQKMILESLSRHVVDLLELRKRTTDLEAHRKLSEQSMEGSDAVNWDWNLREKIRFDSRWNRLLGIPPEIGEFAPRDWLTRVHPEDVLTCQNIFLEYLHGKRDRFEAEYRLKHENGSWIWVLSRGKFSVWDASGKPTRFSGTLVDITKQKSFEAQLIEAQEIAKIGSWKFDLMTENLESSLEHFRIFELPPETPTAKLLGLFRGRVHADDLPKIEAALETLLGSGGEAIVNFRIMLEDGRIKYVQSRARVDSDDQGRPRSLTGICRDLSAEVESTVKYQSLLEENRFILDSLGIGVWIADLKTGTQHWDQMIHQLYETDPKTFSPNFENWLNLLSEESAKFILKETNSLLAGDKSVLSHRIEVKTASGKTKILATRGFIVRDQKNAPVKIYGINWDSTKEAELEKSLELERQRNLHSAKLASIGELAAGVGHEINNPLAILATLISITDQLVEGNAPEVEIREKLSLMEVSVNRIARIVKGLRTFARSDAQDVTTFDPFDMIRETEAFLRDLYAAESIHLDVLLESVDLRIKGNRGRLQQVLVNLLNNARDATKGRSPRRLVIRAGVVGSQLAISVQDNGCGIPPELRQKIFDPFFTTKDVNQGTGIGLSLASTIVKEHHGSIELSSELGVGTEFKVFLPVLERISGTTRKDHPRKQKIPCRILFVDDEPHLREVMREVLTHSCESVDAAGSVAEALSILNAKKFDLIISDIRMPVEDGFDFLRLVRASPGLKALPFIFLTGGTDISKSEQEIIARETQGFYYKPVKINDLLKKLWEMFPHSS